MSSAAARERLGVGVEARTGCRVDLAGGTLDIWPLGVIHRGAATLNVAIDLPVRVSVRAAPLCRVVLGGRAGGAGGAGEEHEAGEWSELLAVPPVALPSLVALELGLGRSEITITSAAPRGSGLGASSSITVALIAAVRRTRGLEPSAAAELVATARDLEARLMSLPTGVQDHYPAVLGGVLHIEHGVGGHRVNRLGERPSRALEESLLVVYSGESHFSAGQNWEVIRRRLDGEAQSIELFERIARVTSSMVEPLEQGDLRRVGALMSEEWSARRQLAPEIETPALSRLLASATEAGAWGGKACGAGGGGSIALLCPPEQRGAIAERLTGEGGAVLETPLRDRALEISVER